MGIEGGGYHPVKPTEEQRVIEGVSLEGKPEGEHIEDSSLQENEFTSGLKKLLQENKIFEALRFSLHVLDVWSQKPRDDYEKELGEKIKAEVFKAWGEKIDILNLVVILKKDIELKRKLQLLEDFRKIHPESMLPVARILIKQREVEFRIKFVAGLVGFFRMLGETKK